MFGQFMEKKTSPVCSVSRRRENEEIYVYITFTICSLCLSLLIAFFGNQIITTTKWL